MTAGIAFSSLSLEKGGNIILDRVSGQMQRGEVTAILGPNGAGKSSLLHSLAGLEPASDGELAIDGQQIATLSPLQRARLIGFLPQRSEVHWNLAVEALVALGQTAVYGRKPESPDDREALARLLVEMDLTHLSARSMHSLSGGEQARVLLARVLAGRPRWLFADEPLANLDPAHQLAVLKRLSQTAKRGTGVVLVLHDINHAARIADHILLMKQGQIVADGRTGDVLTPMLLGQLFEVPFRQVADTVPIFVPSI